MGGKKAVEKSREWERERRDKLNHRFLELSKLLPDHDPSMTLSKKEILTQAAEYIRQLQEQNQQILKEGTDNILKVESERLRRRVAHLLLKTKLLVEALRSAGIPLPSENKKKRKPVKKTKTDGGTGNQNKPTGNQKTSSSGTKNLLTNPQDEKGGKKRVKCGCDKANNAKVAKNPLKEINSTVDTAKTVVAEVNSAEPGKNKQIPDGSATLALAIARKSNDLIKSSPSIVVSVGQPILNNPIAVATGIQQIPLLERNILTSLGPGTLIMADGRIVNVPPPSLVPQIVVKPPPPPATVILLPNTKRKDKKEKLLFPKRREITKTTYANKAPIPAVQTYRLESQPRTRTKRKVVIKKTITVVQKSQSGQGNESVPQSATEKLITTETSSLTTNESIFAPEEPLKQVSPVGKPPITTEGKESDGGNKRKNIEQNDDQSNKIAKIVEKAPDPPELQEVGDLIREQNIQDPPEKILAPTVTATNLEEERGNGFTVQENNVLADKEDVLKTSTNVKYTIDSLFNREGVGQNEQNNQPQEQSMVNSCESPQLMDNRKNLQQVSESVPHEESQVPPETSCNDATGEKKKNNSKVEITNPSCSVNNEVSTLTTSITQMNNAIITAGSNISNNSITNNVCSSTPPTNITNNEINSNGNEVSRSNTDCGSNNSNINNNNNNGNNDLVNHSSLEIPPRSSTERYVDKLYSTNTEGNSFKTDCVLSADFLRSKDIERNTFIPIIDDVRLTSDFSNDLFNSLQVPTGSQHPESISPTAAFLLAFPLVSTSKNTENLTESEANENHTSTPTTILQIGNIEPPSTELFQAMEYSAQKNQKLDHANKELDRYHGFELNTDYDHNIGNTTDIQNKTYNRTVTEKKKDIIYPPHHADFQNKNHRRNCETNISEERQQTRMKNDTVSIPNTFSQTYSYPLFTTCNDFTVPPPPQYSASDPKIDHVNMIPWPTNMDYMNHVTVEKEMCNVQKNKQSCDRKLSKSDKSVQKGGVCNYNYGHNQYQQTDCYSFKQDKKKVKQQQHQMKPPVNWMTTPDSSRNISLEPLPHLDIYTPQKEVETTATFSVPSSSQNMFTNTFTGIEMSVDGFPDFCNSKKTTNNYSWSPSKSLLPSLENHSLMIPSTLPTLVGDLALGTTTPSDTYRVYETKKYDHHSGKKSHVDKTEERVKKRNEFNTKSQVANPSFLSVSQLVDPKCKKQTKQPEVVKQPNCPKRHSDKNMKQQNRNNCNYNSNRKDEPNCMYATVGDKNFLPMFTNQWNDKQRNQFKGGSYSAESLIGVQQEPSTQETFHHANFNTVAYQPVQTSSSTGYFQNPPPGGDYSHQSGHVDNPAVAQQYQNCFNFPTTAQSHHFPPPPFVTDEYQMDGFSFTSTGGQCGPVPKQQIPQQAPQHQRRNNAVTKWREEPKQNPQGSGGIYPCSTHHTNTTTTLTNFNLSTIFPEMNDQRGSSSVQSTHMNAPFGNVTSHNYPIHLSQ